MGRLLEGGEKEGAGQRARTVPRKAGAGDQLGRICRLCDGEATGDCTKGNCVDCCMSNRGEGPFNCCKGPHSYSSSHSSVCLSVVTSQQRKHGRQWMRSRRRGRGRAGSRCGACNGCGAGWRCGECSSISGDALGIPGDAAGIRQQEAEDGAQQAASNTTGSRQHNSNSEQRTADGITGDSGTAYSSTRILRTTARPEGGRPHYRW